MRIIYDNIIFNIQKAGGISSYWKELIERANSDKSFQKEFIEFDNFSKNIFRKNLILDKSLIKIESSSLINIKRYFNISKKYTENVIFHSSYFRFMKGKNVKNIITLYDFIYEKKVKSFKKFIHILQKKRALKKADSIICISESTKRDLIDLYPQLEQDKINVIYLGYDDRTYYNIKNSTIKKEVVFVGGRDGYKNFNLVVNAIQLLDNYVLNIVGSPLSEKEKEFLDSKLKNRYILHPHISNQELNILYNRVQCLLYPSSYEGFGIPILEAMASGCPVVAINISSISEVAGDAAIYIQETPIDIVNAINKLESSINFREEIVYKGFNNIKRFSWDKCYFETIKLYQTFVDSF